MHSVLAAGERIDAHEARYAPAEHQEALALAQARFGHVLCACVQPPRKLVIRNRGGRRSLATWPEDGPAHDPGCPFHEPPNQAKRYVRTEAGDLIVRAGFGLSESRHTRGGSERRRAAAGASHTQPAQASVGLQDLFELLWREAGLHLWRDGWTRDWGRCVYELRRALAHVRLNRRALSDRLYVVPAFRADRREQIDAEWTQFAAPLFEASDTGRAPLRLVLGEVKEIEPTQYGGVVRLRHHAARFYLDRHQLAAWADDAASSNDARCLYLLLIAGTPQGNLRVRDAGRLCVDSNFVPGPRGSVSHGPTLVGTQ